jgi:hypothetical protein
MDTNATSKVRFKNERANGVGVNFPIWLAHDLKEWLSTLPAPDPAYEKSREVLLRKCDRVIERTDRINQRVEAAFASRGVHPSIERRQFEKDKRDIEWLHARRGAVVK